MASSSFDRTGKEPLAFNEHQVPRVRPALANAEGFELLTPELSLIFGIIPRTFETLPKRLVIPVLNGQHHKEHWYNVSGYLYIVEPVAWVPRVKHGDVVPVSVLRSTSLKQDTPVKESQLSVGTFAQLKIAPGALYSGIQLDAHSDNDIPSVVGKDEVETVTGGTSPIHQLSVFPVLRCKAIKKQRIEYSVNDRSAELKWGENSYASGFWDNIRVDSARVNPVRPLQMNPVPMYGKGLGEKTFLLPMPHVTDDGELEITTLFSRQGWVNWFVYDEQPWEPADDTLDFAVPANDVAFKPVTTWIAQDACASLTVLPGSSVQDILNNPGNDTTKPVDDEDHDNTEEQKGDGHQVIAQASFPSASHNDHDNEVTDIAVACFESYRSRYVERYEEYERYDNHGFGHGFGRHHGGRRRRPLPRPRNRRRGRFVPLF